MKEIEIGEVIEIEIANVKEIAIALIQHTGAEMIEGLMIIEVREMVIMIFIFFIFCLSQKVHTHPLNIFSLQNFS